MSHHPPAPCPKHLAAVASSHGPCVEHKLYSPPGQGYARVYVGSRAGGRKRKGMLLHRVVFLRTHGYLPEVVRHICDNQRCINPLHLRPGTQADNVRDMIDRKRYKKRQPGRRLTAIQVAEIRRRWAIRVAPGKGGPGDKVNGPAALGREFRVSPTEIYAIAEGRMYYA